jgi:hypothetical protein
MKSDKRKFAAVLAILVFFISIVILAIASSKSIRGTEIEDKFIKDFFRPEIEHESVKIVETNKGKRYVIIDFGRDLEKAELVGYQISLAKRGFTEYYTWSHSAPSYVLEVLRLLMGGDQYSSYDMSMLRPTNEYGVIEVSRNNINSPGEQLRSAVDISGLFDTVITIEITPEFGHKWEKKTIKPERELICGDPLIGKYPGSLRASVEANYVPSCGWGGYIDITYYVTDSNEAIFEYYRDKFQKLREESPELKIDSFARDFTTAYIYNGLTVRPAKKETLELEGGDIDISISVYESYVSQKIKRLNIDEDISSYKSRAFVNNLMGPNAAVFAKGYGRGIISLLTEFEEPFYLIEYLFSAEELKGTQLLIIPTSGLDVDLIKPDDTKNAIAEYVEQGGTLIVFAQKTGDKYSLLPVPQESDGTFQQVAGYGWNEDPIPQENTVYIDFLHQTLMGLKESSLDMHIAGYFTSYPSSAKILLRRSGSNLPVMIMYSYGQGTVIVAAIYPDSASTYEEDKASPEEIEFVRGLISGAWKINETAPDVAIN